MTATGSTDVQQQSPDAAPALPPTISSVLAEAAASPAPGAQQATATRKTWVLDPSTDRYVEREVPVESLVITESDINEHEDKFVSPLELGEQWERGMGQAFHGYWANIDPRFHTMQRQQGYAPCDPSQFKDQRFQVRELPGLGKCITHGDVFLMITPREHHDRREAAKLARMDRDRAERLYGAHQQMQDTALSAGARMHYLSSRDGDPHGQQRLQTFGQDSEGVEAEAGSYHHAMAMQEADRALAIEAHRSTQVFGGFQGTPEYNRYNPAGPRPNWGFTPSDQR